jgi:hypothetical protein
MVAEPMAMHMATTCPFFSMLMDGIHWPNVLMDPSPLATLRSKQTAGRQDNKSQKWGVPLD